MLADATGAADEASGAWVAGAEPPQAATSAIADPSERVREELSIDSTLPRAPARLWRGAAATTLWTCRRVKVGDLLAYKQVDDAKREAVLDELAAAAQKHGLGY